MRTRQGFVSNSSSVSFTIYGVSLEDGEFPELFTSWGDPKEGFPKDSKLNTYAGSPYSGVIYVGREWCTIEDHETGLQFKKSVEADIRDFFGQDMNCRIWKEGYYNG